MDGIASLITIDRFSPVPLYFQVAMGLEDLIESGRLPAGSRLDTEMTLADRLGLSRPTMRQAIQHLVDKGLVVRKRGVGTQVVHSAVRRKVELTSLNDDLRIADQAIGARRATAAEARLLGDSRGAPLLTMRRTAYDHAGRAIEYGSHV